MNGERHEQKYELNTRRIVTALLIWISAVGTVCLHCTKGEICCPAFISCCYQHVFYFVQINMDGWMDIK